MDRSLPATHDRRMEGEPTPPRLSFRWELALALAITGTAALLRLHGIARAALWYDEGFGLLIARLPWGEMHRALLLDVHPPLWFGLLKLWGTDTVLHARLFGVVLGSLTPLALWAVLRRPLGAWPGLAAAGVIGLMPTHVFYSQELRMYALLGLLHVALLAVALRLTTRHSPLLWILLALCAWAVMATQYLGGFVVGGVWLGLLAARWTSRTFPWFVGWALSAFAAIAGTLPWLLAAAWHMVDAPQGDHALAFLLLRDALEGTQGLVRRAPWGWFGVVGGNHVWSCALAALIIVLILSGMRVLLRDRERRPAGLVLAGAFLGGLILLIAYQAAGRLFFTRFYIILAVPAAALMGAALWQGRVALRVGLMAVLAAGLLSHSLAVGRANGQVREVTWHFERLVEAQGGAEALPPILCSELFLAVPLRALHPEADIRVRPDPEIAPAMRALWEDRLVENWPESWAGRRAWIVLSGWGNVPASGAEGRRRVESLLLSVGSDASIQRIYPMLRAGAGFKWALIAEVE